MGKHRGHGEREGFLEEVESQPKDGSEFDGKVIQARKPESTKA